MSEVLVPLQTRSFTSWGNNSAQRDYSRATVRAMFLSSGYARRKRNTSLQEILAAALFCSAIRETPPKPQTKVKTLLHATFTD
eukprot:5885183-Amphidinium_carterae.1